MNIKEQAKQIMSENGLDFTIHKKPTATINGGFSVDQNGQIHLDEGTTISQSPYFNLINGKTDEVLNSVAKGYTVSQNDEIIEKVLMGIKPFGDQISVNKAGSLAGGKKVFFQIGIEGVSKVGGDSIKRFVTVVDSNDGTTGLSVGIGDIVARCQNQFWKFYKSGMKFRHTHSIDREIQMLPTMIKNALDLSMAQMKVYEKFQSTPVTRKIADEMVKQVLGFNRVATEKELSEMSTRSSNMMNGLYDAIDTEFNQVGQNMWGLFGGVTRWTTHHASAPRRDSGRIESSMVGTNYGRNQKALNFALELV